MPCKTVTVRGPEPGEEPPEQEPPTEEPPTEETPDGEGPLTTRNIAIGVGIVGLGLLASRNKEE